MADDENKTSGGGDSGLWGWIIIILILVAAGEAINGNPTGVLSSSSSGNTTQTQEGGVVLNNPINGTNGGSFLQNIFSESSDVLGSATQDASTDKSFITKIFPKGDLSLDKRVMLMDTQNIRRSVGGGVIGEQVKRSKGYLKEGPITALGRDWWRVDFDKAPDGWVDQSFLTSKVKTFTILNIIPIIFSHIRIIALILILMLLFALGYIKMKENKGNELQKKKKKAAFEFSQQKKDPNFGGGNIVNKDWENVKKHINSPNENDWRQSIIEADIMLDTMLTKIGYDGDTVAEKLKNVEESDFVTLQKAWEAHKIRNRIAHDGSKFKINRKEAERVISLFEQVFKEFYYI